MRFFHETHIDFMGKRKMWYIVSLATVVIGMTTLAIRGLDYGIDFLGGTELIVQFETAPSVGAIRAMMDKNGFAKSEIKNFGEANKILLRTEEQGEGTVIGDTIKKALQESFGDKKPTILQEQKIGPKVGKELRWNALWAVIFSIIAMLIYIGFRFKFIYGVGATVALVHDVFTTLGVLAILNKLTPWTNFEIDQNMIAAFLTLVGMSVNDTVVIFDRIRENQKIYRSMELGELMNKSLNQTLSRTIITSGLIFLVTGVLFIFGGEVNRGFAFTMSFGIITGTYSSIYVASAVVLDYTNYKLRKRNKPAVAEKISYETLGQGS
jgi:preprotein translocase subunit SecF